MDNVTRIRTRLQDEKLDAFLGTNPVNRRYLTGFTGSAGVVWISQQRCVLLTDFRYIEQATEECPGWEIKQIEELEPVLNELITAENVQEIAFESDVVSVSQYEKWENKLEAKLQPTTGWVADLRIIKTSEEIEAISRAAAIADHAYKQILPQIRVGATERDIALELEFIMRKAGASGVSFDPIIATGARSALPHARPGDRVFSHGDFIVMDFGCVYDGYCSDMTRTILVGEPTEQHLLIYDLVLHAQLESLQTIKPGMSGKEVDAIARDIIGDGGYGDYFGHGLGHGVGLEIHENPRLSKKGETTLQPGMIVTVEPGIYLPGFGGVRIEDLVVVTEAGQERLSHSPKELYIVD